MADKKLLYLAIIVVVLTVGYILFFCDKCVEGYVTGGGMDNVGVSNGGCYAYDMINSESPMLYPDTNSFAGMVQENYEPITETIKYEASDRYNSLLASTAMPKVDPGVTPFNVDVTNPQLYQFQVIPNLVQSGGLRSKYGMYDLGTQIRGDIPIRKFNIPLIGATTSSTGERQMGYFEQSNVVGPGNYRNYQLATSGAAANGMGGTIMDSAPGSTPFSM